MAKCSNYSGYLWSRIFPDAQILVASANCTELHSVYFIEYKTGALQKNLTYAKVFQESVYLSQSQILILQSLNTHSSLM